ncbi:MAG TPA: hypothetical protein VGB83_05645 [Actinomycetota bacterium]
MPSDSFRSVFFGRYDEYEAQLVVEILRAEGIEAFTKASRGDHTTAIDYGPTFSDIGVVMVDAAREREARTVVERELPAQLEAIRRTMDAMEETGSAEDDGGL